VSRVKTLYIELIAENEIPGVTRCHMHQVHVGSMIVKQETVPCINDNYAMPGLVIV